MKLPPLQLRPILKERAWGGRTLERFGRALPEGVAIGESWEIADLPESIADGRSIIANGPSAGMPLHELAIRESRALLGRATPGPDGGFPLLVKLLDARASLSVQVHPSPEYAATHPDAHLKTESWIVLDADPGARIFRGVDPSLDADAFTAAARDGSLVERLVSIDVEPGDCIHLESGLCHALGAGIVVLEVQTPSDTTFRVFDWGRDDPSRALHLEEARACALLGTAQLAAMSPIVRPSGTAGGGGGALEHAGFRTWPLVRCAHYEIDRIERDGRPGRMPWVSRGVPEVLFMLAGTVDLGGRHGRLELGAFDTVVVPAQTTVDTLRLSGDAAFIRATPGDPVLANDASAPGAST